MSTDPPTAHYWEALFGITTFEQFQAATNGALDLGLPHFDWVDTPLQKLAYYSPGSVTGAYLTAALTAEGFHEDSPSGPATVTVNSLSTLLNGVAQEAIMGQLVIPGCFQVSINGVAGGRDVFNVLGVQNAAGTAAAAGAAVLAALKVASGPLSVLSNLYALRNIHSVDIGSTGGAIVDIPDTTTGSISAANSFATRGAAALIRWNGSTRNRSSRGRMYFGPLRESDINADGATLVTANQTSINTAMTNFRNSLNAAGYPLVVLSRKTSTAFPVTSHATEATIATQRRRIRS